MAVQFNTSGFIPNCTGKESHLAGQVQLTEEEKQRYAANPSEIMDKLNKIVAVNNYDTSPKFAFVIQVLYKQKWLEPVGTANRKQIQVTAPVLGKNTRRAYVFGMQKTIDTPNHVQFQFVQENTNAVKDYIGRVGMTADSVVETGSMGGLWDLNLIKGTFTYALSTDPGGDLSDTGIKQPWNVAMTYPNFVADQLGLENDMEVVSDAPNLCK